MTLRADTCTSDSGQTIAPYYVQESEDWAHIVAFSSENEILLVSQYRHAAGRIVTELPCGVIDEGEDPLKGAKRELLEETGHTSSHWEALSPLSPNPARMNNMTYGYIAHDVVQSAEQNLDEQEEIEFSFYSIRDVFTLIRDGHFGGAIHGCAIYQALEKKGLLSLSI